MSMRRKPTRKLFKRATFLCDTFLSINQCLPLTMSIYVFIVSYTLYYICIAFISLYDIM